MKRLSKPKPNQPPFDWDTPSPALTAKLRMIELPTDDFTESEKQFIFPHEDLWVPVACVNGNVHILPGVPRLCQYPDRHASWTISLTSPSREAHRRTEAHY